MKKVIIPIILIISVILIFVITKKTYSIFKSNASVNVHSTSDSIICDSVIEDSENSVYGYKLITLKVRNYKTINNVEEVTSIPIKCKFTLTGPSGSKFRKLEDPGYSRTKGAGEGFTNTNEIVLPTSTTFDTFSTTKEEKIYEIEIMTDSDSNASQTNDYDVVLDCYQINN